MATKRLGFESLISSTPPNLDSIGTPCFSSTPFTTTPQTVARPILPSGITTSPSFCPSDAVATSSLTHIPALNTSLITATALVKSFLLKIEVFIGTWPLRLPKSNVVRKASNSSFSVMKLRWSGAKAIRSSSSPFDVIIRPSLPNGCL